MAQLKVVKNETITLNLSVEELTEMILERLRKEADYKNNVDFESVSIKFTANRKDKKASTNDLLPVIVVVENPHLRNEEAHE